MKKIICFIILLLPFLLQAEQLALFNLINESEFKGRWDIERGIPLKLKDKLFSQGFKDVIRVDTPHPRKNLVNGYSVSGMIREFKLISTGLVSSGLGGVQKYTVKIKIRFEIYSSVSPKTPQTFEIDREISDNKIGLTLLGGPSGNRDMYDTPLFDQIQATDFNSPEFDKTIYGKCLDLVLEETMDKIRFLLGSEVITQYSNSINLSDADWKFTTGDSAAFAQKAFVENFWKDVKPGRREKKTPDFSGFGWYRVKVFIPGSFRNKSLFLSLGRLGDVDITYINSTKIGSSGGFPPDYKSSRELKRSYAIPSIFIRYDEINLLAIRVYCKSATNGQNASGLLDEKVSIECSK